MRFKKTLILFSSIIIIGISIGVLNFGKVSAQDTKLKIIRSEAALKRGDAGFITIQGKPRTQYTLKTTYKVNNRTIPIIQIRTTNAQGEATFNWVVGMETTPSTQGLTIYGGGETIQSTHVVVP